MFSSSLLAFTSPSIDFHSFAPEIVVLGVLVAVLLVDLFTDDGSALAPSIASIGMLLAIIPLITLATTDHWVHRTPCTPAESRRAAHLVLANLPALPKQLENRCEQAT